MAGFPAPPPRPAVGVGGVVGEGGEQEVSLFSPPPQTTDVFFFGSDRPPGIGGPGDCLSSAFTTSHRSSHASLSCRRPRSPEVDEEIDVEVSFIPPSSFSASSRQGSANGADPLFCPSSPPSLPACGLAGSTLPSSCSLGYSPSPFPSTNLLGHLSVSRLSPACKDTNTASYCVSEAGFANDGRVRSVSTPESLLSSAFHPPRTSRHRDKKRLCLSPSSYSSSCTASSVRSTPLGSFSPSRAVSLSMPPCPPPPPPFHQQGPHLSPPSSIPASSSLLTSSWATPRTPSALKSLSTDGSLASSCNDGAGCVPPARHRNLAAEARGGGGCCVLVQNEVGEVTAGERLDCTLSSQESTTSCSLAPPPPSPHGGERSEPNASAFFPPAVCLSASCSPSVHSADRSGFCSSSARVASSSISAQSSSDFVHSNRGTAGLSSAPSSSFLPYPPRPSPLPLAGVEGGEAATGHTRRTDAAAGPSRDGLTIDSPHAEHRRDVDNSAAVLLSSLSSHSSLDERGETRGGFSSLTEAQREIKKKLQEKLEKEMEVYRHQLRQVECPPTALSSSAGARGLRGGGGSSMKSRHVDGEFVSL